MTVQLVCSMCKCPEFEPDPKDKYFLICCKCGARSRYLMTRPDSEEE